MKFANRIICVAVACAMALTSCVKSSEMEFHEVERIALQAWIEQHRPDLLENYRRMAVTMSSCLTAAWRTAFR